MWWRRYRVYIITHCESRLPLFTKTAVTRISYSATVVTDDEIVGEFSADCTDSEWDSEL